MSSTSTGISYRQAKDVCAESECLDTPTNTPDCIKVVEPTDHGFCKSIYFFDPKRTPHGNDRQDRKPGDRDRFAQAAHKVLAEWEARRKQGVLTSEMARA